MLASFIQTFADNGFLEVKDLGVLSQVSKQLNAAANKDAVWERLCRRDWPATSSLSENFKRFGYRKLYQRWDADRIQGSASFLYLPELPPPSCNAGDIELAINVKYEDRPLLSEIIAGDKMETFLEEGQVGLKLAKPFVLGKAEWMTKERGGEEFYLVPRDDGFCGLQSKDINGEMHNDDFWAKRIVRPKGILSRNRVFVAKIHYFRHTDLTMSCISLPSGGYASTSEEACCTPSKHSGGNEIDSNCEANLPMKIELDDYSYGCTPLRETYMATEINRRLFGDGSDGSLTFSIQLVAPVLASGYIAVNAVVLKAFVCYACGEERFFPGEFEGVTLLHYMSEIEATKMV